jgi:hypothetical protein
VKFFSASISDKIHIKWIGQNNLEWEDTSGKKLLLSASHPSIHLFITMAPTLTLEDLTKTFHVLRKKNKKLHNALNSVINELKGCQAQNTMMSLKVAQLEKCQSPNIEEQDSGVFVSIPES